MANAEFPGLEKHRIDSLPEGLYYIPNFLSPEEQRSLLEKVSPTTSWLIGRYQADDGLNSLIAVSRHTRHS
jgi:hypothetical protein